jgi:hypothetical protein
MRPSNGSIAQNVAAEVLQVVFRTLPEMDVQIGLAEMRILMDRVDRRLNEMHGTKQPQRAEARGGQPT